MAAAHAGPRRARPGAGDGAGHHGPYWPTAKYQPTLADFTPYVLRHSLATELRSRGVPEWECAGWLGHRTAYRTTEIYAKYRPEFLSQARAAIDAWMKEIGALLAAAPRSSETPVRVQYVPGLSPRPAKTLKMVGATGIEPVTPTMST